MFRLKTSIAASLLFLILLYFQAGCVFGQKISNFKIEHIFSENVKLEKGLSQNSIHSILQDSYGYIWFGTWDGLNRFDGYNFNIYRKNIEHPEEGLSSSNITALFEDYSGFLWIGTGEGLNCLDRKTKRIRQFKSGGSGNAIVNDNINCIAQDRDSCIWIGTSGGLNMYDPKRDTFYTFTSDPYDLRSLSDNEIRHIFYDRYSHCLWIATPHGLNHFDIKDQKIRHYFFRKNIPGSISNNSIYHIIRGSDDLFWIATDVGLNSFDPETEIFRQYVHDPSNYNSINDNKVRCLCEDRFGLLWVGTESGGLNLLDKEKGIFYHFMHAVNDPNTISNNSIQSIYEDRSGIIWVGTRWRGVNMIDRKLNRFNHYSATTDSRGLNNNLIWSIFEDSKGVIWMGTLGGGINLMQQSTGKFSFLTTSPEPGKGLASNNVSCINEDLEGNMWIGSFDRGLVKYDPDLDYYKYFRFDPSNVISISSDNINDICFDSYNNMWVATHNGLNLFNAEEESFTSFHHHTDDLYSISDNNVASVYEDMNGYLWVCTYGGLNLYDRTKKRFISFKSYFVSRTKMDVDVIFSLYQDKEMVYWIATQGAGLLKYDRKADSVKAYTEKDGLSNNVVYDILEDKKGNLWLSTNYGLSRFNKKTETFVNFDVNDGIQSHEFNLGAACLSSDGEMFFGGMKGFNRFYPDKIRTNPNIPPVAVTAFKIYNETQPRDYEDGDTIFLSYRDNFFSFEFSALDYTNPSKNQYEYMLEKVDKEWIRTNAERRYAEYTGLAPGNYIFIVKGSNNDGIWNEEGFSLTVIIKPPWWASNYFRIPFILLLAGIIWLFIYNRIRRIRKKHTLQKKMLDFEKQLFDIEQKALRLQMNPHFIFNSLNSIQSFVIANDTDKAISYLAKFAQLMRLIMANSRESYVPLKDEIRALTYYMEIERLRFNEKFDFNIKLDPGIDEDFIAIPPMIIQPYVENSILHGIVSKRGKGHILLEITRKDDTMYCIVEDDGIGREKAQEIRDNSGITRKSRGMMITRERLELLEKQNNKQFSVHVIDLTDEKGAACGTRVELVLQFKEC